MRRDQVPAAGVDDDHRDDESADHSADDPVADLFEQEFRWAAAVRDLGIHVGDCHGREQQGHADSVVEPALDVEALPDPAGTRGWVTTACPRAASVGARTTPRMTASSIQCAEDRPAERVPSAMVSGSPIPSRRTGTPMSRRRSRDRCARLGRTTRAPASPPPGFARSRSSSRGRSAEHLGPANNPTATNTIAGVIGDPTDAARSPRRRAGWTPTGRATTPSRCPDQTSCADWTSSARTRVSIAACSPGDRGPPGDRSFSIGAKRRTLITHLRRASVTVNSFGVSLLKRLRHRRRAARRAARWAGLWCSRRDRRRPPRCARASVARRSRYWRAMWI